MYQFTTQPTGIFIHKCYYGFVTVHDNLAQFDKPILVNFWTLTISSISLSPALHKINYIKVAYNVIHSLQPTVQCNYNVKQNGLSLESTVHSLVLFILNQRIVLEYWSNMFEETCYIHAVYVQQHNNDSSLTAVSTENSRSGIVIAYFYYGTLATWQGKCNSVFGSHKLRL